MYRKRLTTALLLTTTLAVAFAPAASAHRPDPVQRQLDLLVERDGVPGALAFDGRTTRTAGVADRQTGRAMVGSDGRFRVASNTKAFTAAAVMRLVADGRIGLDHRAGSYVPQLAGHSVTVRQLLKQTSGLPEYTPMVDWSRPGTSEDQLALALAQPPVFGPGEDWGYSNTNYLVLGLVIDKVSGVGFRAYVEREILRPLRLRDTYWPAPGELALRGPHARNYGVDPADPGAGRVDVTDLPGHEFGASGGLVSTPRDLNAFWDGLFGGRLLPGWAVRLMTGDTTDIGGRDVCLSRREPVRLRGRFRPAQLRRCLLGPRRRSAGEFGRRRPVRRRPGHRDRLHHHVDGRGRGPAPPPRSGGRGPLRPGPLSDRRTTGRGAPTT